jgi:predicted RNase H-like HicB family nuclease
MSTAGHRAAYGRSREGYLIAFEKSRTGFSAYSPEVPGCIAAGRTVHETEKLMRRAITFHLRGMRRQGERVQRPRSFAELRRKRLL